MIMVDSKKELEQQATVGMLLGKIFSRRKSEFVNCELPTDLLTYVNFMNMSWDFLNYLTRFDATKAAYKFVKFVSVGKAGHPFLS